MITIYRSDIAGNAGNCNYPNEFNVDNLESLKEAVCKDYVCARYKNNYRNNDNFISSNCLPVDCDNDHSDAEKDWITVDDVKKAFPNVTFYVHYSRNHMKEKRGKAARPKFHILFPIDNITIREDYALLKKKITAIFPYFDRNALDAARFFFGTEDPNCEIVKGSMNLSEFLGGVESFEDMVRESKKRLSDGINQGSRNGTMSHYAGKVLKKYGETDEAWEAFLEIASNCNPPLDSKELKGIWESALTFYRNKILKNPNYIPPDKYIDSNSYIPADFTDVGQATVLAKYFSNELRYSPSTHFIRFKEGYWEESEIGAQAVVHELTRRQLLEAERIIFACNAKLKESGALDLIDEKGKKATDELTDEQMEILKKQTEAQCYKKFVLGRRESKYISACLKEVKPMIEISQSDLDSNPFLLCTPGGTYDLRKGMDGKKEHDPGDFITKITACAPSDKGKEIWEACLNKIFAKNPELIDYVQMTCGLAAIGKVMQEGMIIAYGDGGNGKSTFWNAIFRTLGLYSGKISADTLTTQCRRNTKPEMAEAKGKRLLIASELQQGARLDESMVKQLTSTDEVQAEKKYKDPFHYVPCHTLVLYTNYLPRISGIDDGIWDRLYVIPFNNKLRGGAEDIKNYADFLFENAGEYILKWIVEGAKKVIEAEYKPTMPAVVREAIDSYREQNNWFNHFLEDCCEKDKKAYVSSNQLYAVYRRYSAENNEYTRSTNDFYGTLEKYGFKRGTEKRVRVIYGLRLSVTNEIDEDFLT